MEHGVNKTGGIIQRTPACHFSGMEDLEIIMSMGNVPIADKLLNKSELAYDNYTAPLNLAFSKGSKLVQLVETVPAETLYDSNYPYFSSVSPRLLQHFENSARNIIKNKKLNENSLVVEAASNDGYMLQYFTSCKIPVLGIEPARRQAEIAIRKNIPTLNTFFSSKLALDLVSDNKSADVFIGNNILAHAEDLNDFVNGISLILKPGGIAIMEVPYVVDMIENCEFDTIYHQHIYYFSLTSLMGVFQKFNLYINSVEKQDIHGGSLRIFVEHIYRPDKSVTYMLDRESEIGIDTPGYYKSLESRANQFKKSLLELVSSLKNKGKKIAAYGAAAKASTFLSYMELDKSHIDYIVDRNSFKHGKFMPGNHLEIFQTGKLLEDIPDYTLVLAWNFAEEIIREMKAYSMSGGKFIIPIPDLKVV